MTVNLGIIGAGSVAAIHAKAAVRAGSRVAAVYDVDGARAERLAAGCDGARAVSLKALLEDPAIDAGVVACPNAYHKDTAIALLEAGKDVLLEKPMAMSTAECDEIIAAAGAAGRRIQMGFVCRCAPASRAVGDLVSGGRLGRIYHAKASLYRQRGIPGLGRWFTTRSLSGGGVLMDLGVHLLDLVVHLCGSPRPARASCVCTSTFGAPIDGYRYADMWAGPPVADGVFDVEDGATALVRFDGGLSMELDVCWASNVPEAIMPEGIVLLGDRGGCFFHLWRNELILTTERDGAMVDEPIALPDVDAWDAAWTEQHRRFARTVEARRPPGASAAEGRAVQVLIDALYRSAAEGREVEVPA